MDNESWSFKISDLWTVPNLLTYLRFLLVVPFMYFFLQQNYIGAAVCIGFSGLTDCFDGLLARKLNQVTSLGKILDPIADKLTLFSVALCMIIYYPAILPLDNFIFSPFLQVLVSRFRQHAIRRDILAK